jgi:hypothetical protein
MPKMAAYGVMREMAIICIRKNHVEDECRQSWL